MTEHKHYINRYVWVYLVWNKEKQYGELAIWQSPDENAVTLGLTTPYHYTLSRNDVRYVVKSEVELTQTKAVEIAKELYECEFVNMPKELRRKQRR